MKYQRAALIDLVTATRAAHVAAINAKHKADIRDHNAELARWRKSKRHHIATLEAAVEALRQDREHDLYRLADRIPQPPGPAPSIGDTCSPRVQQLDALHAVLDTIADSTISSAALASAGVRDLTTLLRHPCP